MAEAVAGHGAEKKGWIGEDWLSLILGLVIFAISLGAFQGNHFLGWGAKMGVWTEAGKAISPISSKLKAVKGEITAIDGQKITVKDSKGKSSTVTDANAGQYQVGQPYSKAGMSSLTALFFTFLFALAIMSVGAIALGANVPRFMIAFTLAFWLAYLCWFLGHYAYIAATKEQATKMGLAWSMSMTGEFGYIIALVMGLVIGNFFPGLANAMKEAARPELFIKTGIVIMGAGLGIKAAQSFGLASNIMFRGFCAIVEAYLI